jgi:hypothetical protein
MKVDYHTFISQTTKDTIYFKKLYIHNKKKSVLILDHEVPIYRLMSVDGYTKSSGGYTSFNAKYINDSLIIKDSRGGQGGQAIWLYRGKKL